MTSQHYAMVRGSTVRVTALSDRGRLDSTAVRYGVSRSISKIDIAEVTESGSADLVRNDEDQPRFLFIQPDKTIRYEADIRFLSCQPEILSLVAGVPVVTNALGDIVGFDADTKIKAKAFALEVWSKLNTPTLFDLEPQIGFGVGGFGVQPFGRSTLRGREWGYTLFPFLKGGYLSGFSFDNGLVSFTLSKARCSRAGRWGVGPYDLGLNRFERLLEPVSRNTNWRTFRTFAQPPEPFSGVSTFEDVIYGGSDGSSSPDTIYGGSGGSSTEWIIEGGGAA